MVIKIGFIDGTEPQLKEGQFTTWKQYDDEYPFRIIRRKRIFIEGVYVVFFVVQLKE